MKALKGVLDIITGKRRIIKEYIGGSGMCLIDKTPNIASKKARVFFHHSIVCCVTDAFEYFLNADALNNVFYKNIEKITCDTGERFIKWETAYHTLFFTNEMQSDADTTEFENTLFSIFGFDDAEEERYYNFKGLLAESYEEFIDAFSNAAVFDVFGIEKIEDTDTSFIYNFYHNCYTEFYRTYSKYSLVTGIAGNMTKIPAVGDMRPEMSHAGS